MDDTELSTLTLEEASLMQEAVLFEIVDAFLLSLSPLLRLFWSIVPCVLDPQVA